MVRSRLKTHLGEDILSIALLQSQVINGVNDPALAYTFVTVIFSLKDLMDGVGHAIMTPQQSRLRLFNKVQVGLVITFFMYCDFLTKLQWIVLHRQHKHQ